MTWAELGRLLQQHGCLWPGDVPGRQAAAANVTGVSYDSRKVEPGHVFVAIKGQHTDGADFAIEALARGAIVVVSERPAPADAGAWTRVQDARASLALLAASFYRHPSEAMQVVGVTGTNGKTTTAHLIASVFEAAGIRCGLLGTVAYRVGVEAREATRTTPEAPDVQRLLREMVDTGCGACAMEVSSHALTLARVDHVRFTAGVFTNLTRDHLDFHGNMEAYFKAKRRLFEMLPREAPALINLDDPKGAALVQSAARPVSYAIERRADLMPGPVSSSLDGLAFDIRTPRGGIHIRSGLVGRPNVYNILAAVAVATALGLSFDAIERGVAALDAVPGRFQIVSSRGDDLTVVVDYAHTDDALRNLLDTARPLTRGRLITVFGCGGDRDRTKRPLMGAVAGRLSDVVVITSDNPRNEDPQGIIDQIRRGITQNNLRGGAGGILTMVDRREAIERAVELARAGDLVLIAGKGHETYQVIGGRSLPFDDVAVAREALIRRRSNSGVL